MFCMLLDMKVFHMKVLYFGQKWPKYMGKFVISLWYLKKEVENEVRDLTALAASSTTPAIYYTYNVNRP